MIPKTLPNNFIHHDCIFAKNIIKQLSCLTKFIVLNSRKTNGSRNIGWKKDLYKLTQHCKLRIYKNACDLLMRFSRVWPPCPTMSTMLGANDTKVSWKFRETHICHSLFAIFNSPRLAGLYGSFFGSVQPNRINHFFIWGLIQYSAHLSAYPGKTLMQ